jgi:anti-anti-sigma factor
MCHRGAPDLGSVRSSHHWEGAVAVVEQPTVHRSGFRVGREVGDCILWVTGEHDISTVQALRLVLADLIALDERDIVVDLTEATFVGSVMIGELLRARTQLAEGDRWLTVRAPRASVRRMFEICDVRDLFNLRGV